MAETTMTIERDIQVNGAWDVLEITVEVSGTPAGCPWNNPRDYEILGSSHPLTDKEKSDIIEEGARLALCEDADEEASRDDASREDAYDADREFMRESLAG